MSTRTSHGPPTRRRLIAGGAAAFAAACALPGLARSATGSATTWLDYQKMLTARLDDAGGGRFEADFAVELLAELNRFRSAQGGGPVRWDEGLAVCARAHIADMASRGYFAHESPEGFGHPDRVSLLNRRMCGRTGENLAWRDYPTQQTTPRHFQSMWEASPGHRRNLLNPAFGAVGYGVLRRGSRLYAAGVYGDAAVRLGQIVPLTVHAYDQIAEALSSASPHVDRIALTAPFEKPVWTAAAGQALPLPTEGVWQLRPLSATAPGRYAALPGPIFHIA